MAKIETVREALKEVGRQMASDDEFGDRALQALSSNGEYMLITRVSKRPKGAIVASHSYMTAGNKGHAEFIRLREE